MDQQSVGHFIKQSEYESFFYKGRYPILIDTTSIKPEGTNTKGSVTDLFQVRAVPTTFFIDKDGVIKKIFVGNPSEIKQYLTEVLQVDQETYLPPATVTDPQIIDISNRVNEAVKSKDINRLKDLTCTDSRSETPLLDNLFKDGSTYYGFEIIGLEAYAQNSVKLKYRLCSNGYCHDIYEFYIKKENGKFCIDKFDWENIGAGDQGGHANQDMR